MFFGFGAGACRHQDGAVRFGFLEALVQSAATELDAVEMHNATPEVIRER